MSDPTVDLAARLTAEVSRDLLAYVSDAELAALHRYQSLDRTYVLVNQFLRGERPPGDLSVDESSAVRRIVRGLDAMARRWRTPEPIDAYRGVRSRAGFDVEEVPQLSRSFLSTTIFRNVAVGEFTVPPGSSGPALLQIAVPAGTPAMWVPALGDPGLAYQGELLLPRGVRLAVRGSHDEAGILVVDCEVQP